MDMQPTEIFTEVMPNLVFTGPSRDGVKNKLQKSFFNKYLIVITFSV